MKPLRLLLLACLAATLAACSDKRHDYEYIVFDGLNRPVEYRADGSDSLSALEPLTLVTPLDTAADGQIRFVTADSVSGQIAPGKIRKRGVWYTGDFTMDKNWRREARLHEELRAEGSTLSARLFSTIEQLHFYKGEYNPLTWALAFIAFALLSGICLALAFMGLEDGPSRPGFAFGYLAVAFFLGQIASAAILFIVQEPFEDSAHSGAGWLADLLIFVGLLAGGLYMWSGFVPLMEILNPYGPTPANLRKGRRITTVASWNIVVLVVLTIAYGLCLWLAKGAADAVLRTIIGVQAAFSLAMLAGGLLRGGLPQALAYVVVFPVCYAVIGTTVLTLGFMVFVLACLAIGGGSLLTQSANGMSFAPSAGSGTVSDGTGGHHWTAAENADGSLTDTDGTRRRQMPDGSWKEF